MSEVVPDGAEWQMEHINARMGTALSPSLSLFPALFISLETFDSDNQEEGEEHLSCFSLFDETIEVLMAKRDFFFRFLFIFFPSITELIVLLSCLRHKNTLKSIPVKVK